MSISTEPIAVRDFLRNFVIVTKKSGKKRYIIMKHGRPIGMFIPWDMVKQELLQDTGNPWAFLANS